MVSGSTKLVTGVQRQKVNGISAAQLLVVTPPAKPGKKFQNVTNDDIS